VTVQSGLSEQDRDAMCMPQIPKGKQMRLPIRL
jgi:hypothetical protein